MKIAESRTRKQYPLSPKKIIKKTITGTIVYLVLAIFIGGMVSPIFLQSTASNNNFVGFFGTFIVFITIFLLIITFLNYLYQRWYFAVYYYELAPDYIVIKKGPITPKEITIPYERIQDVYVDQDVFDRLFGIYDVHLSSATISSGMAAHIDGVEKLAADGLRNELLTTIKSRISKSTTANATHTN